VSSARRRWLPPAKTIAAVVVVAIALLELFLHLAQVREGGTDSDYREAARLVANQLRPDDQIVFSPPWTDSLGRMAFGELMTLERAAPTDTTRFARVFEVAQSRARHPEYTGFDVEQERRIGGLILRVAKNPQFAPVRFDVVTRFLQDGGATVSQVLPTGPQPCSVATGAQGAPWDPARPARFFSCANNPVGVIALVDSDYHPRRCIFARTSQVAVLRIRIRDLQFGSRFVGHHGLHRAQEQKANTETTRLRFIVDAETPDGHISERELGQALHVAGEGFREFHFDVPEALTGQSGDLTIEVSGPDGQGICFEVTSR
jgi:hypothetical protein